MKQCIVCEKDFHPLNPKGVYCSSKCKMKDVRRKKGAKSHKPKPQHYVKQEIAKPSPPTESKKHYVKQNDEFVFPNDLDKIEKGFLDKPALVGPPVTVTLKPPADPVALNKELNELVNSPENKPGVLDAIINGGTVKLMPKGLSLSEQIDWRIKNEV